MQRSEKAATIGSGPQEGDPESVSVIFSVPAKRAAPLLPSTQLQTHIHSRTPLRTVLNTDGEGSKRGVPRLSNSRFQLRRPGARVVPGMEKLPQTSQAALRRGSQPAARAGVGGGGEAEEGGDGPGKDAELTCDATGERFHSPSLRRPAPFCQPGSEAHRRFFLSLLASFGFFDSPFQKGSTLMT